MRSRNAELNDDCEIEAKGVRKWIRREKNAPAKRLGFSWSEAEERRGGGMDSGIYWTKIFNTTSNY